MSKGASPSSLPEEGNDKLQASSGLANREQMVETTARPMPQAASESAWYSVDQTLEAAIINGDTKQLTAAIRAAVQALSCGSLSSARMTEVRA